MYTALVLAALLTSQFPVRIAQPRICVTSSRYQQTYNAVPAYAANKSYAASYYNTYNNAVHTNFVATELYEPVVYGFLAGGAQRAEGRRREDREVISGLTTRIGELTKQLQSRPAPVPGSANPGDDTVPPPPEVPNKPDDFYLVASTNWTPPLRQPSGSGLQSVPPQAALASLVGSFRPTATRPKAEVLSVFSNGCIKCHTDPANAGGKYKLYDSNRQFRTDLGVLDKISVALETYTESMPRDGSALDTAAMSHVLAWTFDEPEEFRAWIDRLRAMGIK